MKYMESVKNLRAQIAQKKSPVCKCPGVYRWWFKEDAALELLKVISDLDISKLHKRIINEDVYYALYFGISNNMKQRAKWHMCQHHTPSSIKSGYLSTLRQTLSALLEVDMSKSEAIVNNYMDDNCCWEWCYTDTDEEAANREKQELSQSDYCYPLNIQKNRTVTNQWRSRLKLMRNNYKSGNK